jgi:hypothetical protein
MGATQFWLVVALCFTGFGTWIICYWAPHCPMPPNPCRRFILISPLYQPDPWGEKADAEPAPWWVHAIEYGTYVVILCCMVYPFLGFIVLFIIASWMTWQFIQKITETGRYAQQQEGESI